MNGFRHRPILGLIAAVTVILGLFCGPAFAQIPLEVTRLVQDVDSRDPGIIGRQPLILIHGFLGTADGWFEAIDGTTSDEKLYFQSLINHFYSTGLKDKYKLYRFHYRSNVLPVSELARGLREWLDSLISQGRIVDEEFVIVAHSMGGLVGRSYMAEQTHTVGQYSGQAGGERISKLITLGTPHHGSPAANDQARDTGSADWNGLIQTIDLIFWGDETVTDPNRSDLRWDNYNNLPGYGVVSEYNAWLNALNNGGLYLNKVTAYYGGVDGDNYTLKLLRDQLATGTSSDFSGLYLLSRQNGFIPAANDNPLLFPYRGPYDYRVTFDIQAEYCFAAVLLKKIYNVNNDALVPVDSGRLEKLNLLKTVFFDGFDHEDMKSDHSDSPSLFSTLQAELGAGSDDGDGDGDGVNGVRINGGCFLSVCSP